MRPLFHFSAFVSLFVVLAGCGANEASIYRSFQVGKPTGQANSVLIDAKQRAILSVPASGAGAAALTGTPEQMAAQAARRRDVIVCAEPSPDALSAISSTFAASAGGLFPSGEEVQASIARALQETATQLGQRNATIQLLRDGLYRQCEAYMNGLIDKHYYEQIANKYANAMVTLLAVEQLTGQGATSVKVAGEKGTSAQTDVTVSGAAPAGTSPATTGGAGDQAATTAQPLDETSGQDTTGDGGGGGSGSTGASGSAGAPAVAVNLSSGAGTQQQHVSTAVNTMVTWFLTKDTVDYCLRALFEGTTEGSEDFRRAFIGVCTKVIEQQMAQQGQITSAYRVTTSGGEYSDDRCSMALRSFWKPDGNTIDRAHEATLTATMRDHGVTAVIPTLIGAPEFADSRRQIGTALNLSDCN